MHRIISDIVKCYKKYQGRERRERTATYDRVGREACTKVVFWTKSKRRWGTCPGEEHDCSSNRYKIISLCVSFFMSIILFKNMGMYYFIKWKTKISYNNGGRVMKLKYIALRQDISMPDWLKMASSTWLPHYI